MILKVNNKKKLLISEVENTVLEADLRSRYVLDILDLGRLI